MTWGDILPEGGPRKKARGKKRDGLVREVIPKSQQTGSVSLSTSLSYSGSLLLAPEKQEPWTSVIFKASSISKLLWFPG